MAKHGSSEVTVSVADAPGGTLRAVTPYINTIGGYKKEIITQQTNPFGVGFVSNTPVGVTQVADITFNGFFDDTAVVGPHVVFKLQAGDASPSSVGRQVVIVAATGATFTITMHLVSYEVVNKSAALTEYNAVMRQLSDGVWS